MNIKNLFKTTKRYRKFWSERKIDWNKHYLSTIEHPHRNLIIKVLKHIPWVSLFEIGCGPGANLLKIIKEIPKKQIGGIDVNPDAIELAKKMFNNGVFQVGCADDIMLSDKSSDVVLSDMVLIYVSPKDIRRHIQEIYRITRNYVVLCEFHAKSRWKRLLLKIRTGYNAHNFQKLLEQNGFYDVSFVKMREVDWPGFPQNEYGYLIIAKKC